MAYGTFADGISRPTRPTGARVYGGLILAALACVCMMAVLLSTADVTTKLTSKQALAYDTNYLNTINTTIADLQSRMESLPPQANPDIQALIAGDRAELDRIISE
jgi:hypothetical protein